MRGQALDMRILTRQRQCVCEKVTVYTCVCAYTQARPPENGREGGKREAEKDVQKSACK